MTDRTEQGPTWAQLQEITEGYERLVQELGWLLVQHHEATRHRGSSLFFLGLGVGGFLNLLAGYVIDWWRT